ncbi:MAG: SpoIID/LytB domain-containing protein, partial [Solirubrobacterales bacterium]
FGHGIGMSQYGAYGYAKNGTGYAAILAHYYLGTALGASAPQTIRVLLAPNAGSVSFSSASSACGASLDESATYSASRIANKVILHNPGGASIGDCGSLLSASGGDSVNLNGKGVYRGALEVRPSTTTGVNAINAVDLESYVQGVVPREMPASWPAEALKAQAVAARSYALSTGVNGNGFDQYDDTRSQVYGGMAAETAKTNAAVLATPLQVLNYGGRPATTYFFSTSGGHTESIEFSFVGSAPKPYLKGVPDPYDALSPYHRWRLTLSQTRMQQKLRRYLKGGRLRKIRVKKRGTSPRIVRAVLVTSAGRIPISGPTLRTALGLRDTWAFFQRVKR